MYKVYMIINILNIYVKVGVPPELTLTDPYRLKDRFCCVRDQGQKSRKKPRNMNWFHLPDRMQQILACLDLVPDRT